MNGPRTLLKAFWQLGPCKSALFAWYQALLRTGLLRLLTPARPAEPEPPEHFQLTDLLQPLTRQAYGDFLGPAWKDLLEHADLIVSGEYRLFGAEARPLDFYLKPDLDHWTKHKAAWVDGQDIKFIWEPGRFGWAIILARAYHFTQEPQYAHAFWRYTEVFLQAHPPNTGPHWASAQEVALRLMALAFCLPVFKAAADSTPERLQALSAYLAAHAERIPPTLSYARAQNNNHLLTEALGLYTAAALLPDHPQAARWRALGWRWLNYALQTQISPDGAYIQNSANYHRLMLSAALWASQIANHLGDTFPNLTRARLAAAARWLLAMLDRESGQAPNLGPNDGAEILPLAVTPFEDYRPILQAATAHFLGERPFPPGPWDEVLLWLPAPDSPPPPETPTPKIYRLDSKNSWAVLRSARFRDRPGHADQLHVDLWWRGLNLALDPDTYLYNAPPPWENAFSGTDVHNTLTIDHQDQMTRAGRFLWLDWAQAEVIEQTHTQITARHDGYRKLGLAHQRVLTLTAPDNWQITDEVSHTRSSHASPYTLRLHWLLPDRPWHLDDTILTLDSPHGPVKITVESRLPLKASLARAGELLHGEAGCPSHRGWFSPTYGEKQPALSFALTAQAKTLAKVTTTWILD